MKLQQLLKQITPLPWFVYTAEDRDKWIGTTQGDDRIATLDGNTRSIDYEYLVHAGNALPELLAAAQNLQDNWEHNLTEPMARLNDAIEMSQDVNVAKLRPKSPNRT